MALTLSWTFPAERILEGLGGKQAVHCGLTGENSRLLLVSVMRDITPDIRTSAHAHKRRHSSIRESTITVQFPGITRERMNEGPVCSDRECGDGGERKKPGGVSRTQMKRARPYGLLVASNVPQQ